MFVTDIYILWPPSKLVAKSLSHYYSFPHRTSLAIMSHYGQGPQYQQGYDQQQYQQYPQQGYGQPPRMSLEPVWAVSDN
jgi:hypothetical protein